jgi:hypothetical protein
MCVQTGGGVTLVAEQSVDTWKPTLSAKQSEAWWLLQSDIVEELLYGGAKGGGKSWFGCHWMYHECYEIARKYVPKALRNPIPVAFMGRKVAKHFKETTLDTWKRFIPPERYKIKGDPAEITIADRVLIRTGGLEAKEDLEKFNSAEFARIFVDQAEETSIDDISVLRASLRLAIGGRSVPPKVLWTANPGQCWLKEAFIDNSTESMPFVRALPSDNTRMPGLDAYIKRLELAFKHRPELLAAYKDGVWDAFEDGDQLILGRWIDSAFTNTNFIGMSGFMIACDPARFGDDETVVFLLNGTDIKDHRVWGKCRTTDISAYITQLSRQHGHCPAVIDSIGIGGGVIDECHEKGVSTLPFTSSEKAEDFEKFYNLRAEAWWLASKLFSEGKVRLTFSEDELRKQLPIPKYYFRNGRIIVEDKSDIKKRLSGRSPDWADCYVMGLWAQHQSQHFRKTVSLSDIRRLQKAHGLL